MCDDNASAQMRDEYLKRVDDLFSQSRAWIAETDPEAEVTQEEIEISEEPVGSYHAKVLVIKRHGYKTVSLIPRGRWIIGAEGRVDMKSDLGTETLVYVAEGGSRVRINALTENGKILKQGRSQLIESDVADGWVFVQNRQVRFLPSLDDDLFHRLLEVLGR